ncbi:MAG: sugar-binding protein [Armatimonadota bacterium]
MRNTVLAVALLLGICSLPVLAQDEVSIILGQTNKESGITLVQPEEGATTVVTKGGSECRSTVPPAGKTGGYMYFAVDKAFAFEGSVTDLYVTVEYYDEGTDQFRLEYDAVGEDPEVAMFTAAEGGAPMVKYDSKKWLQHTFHLTNVFFGKRQPGGADFRIFDMTFSPETGETAEGEGPEFIRKVTVSKVAPIAWHIKYTDTPVKIDGKLDDPAWQEAMVFRIDQAWQDVIRPTKWTGPDDFSADARFAWDKDYLYVSYDCVDDVPRCNNDSPPNLIWNGDGNEVYFGFDQSNPGRTSYIEGQDYQFIMSAGPNPTWAIFRMGGPVQTVEDGTLLSPEGNLVVVDKPNGYILEARIPWSAFLDAEGKPHTAPTPGQLVGFNVFANDGDNPDAPAQEKAMSFTGRPGAWGNPSAWATVQLDPPAPKAVLGDMNGDGKVGIPDVTLALQMAVGKITPSAAQLAAGDLNKNGKIEITEVIKILRAAVGMEALK